MLVSTTILKQHIQDVKIVRRIINRATYELGVKTVSKMSKNERGDIGSYTHFDLDEWIKCQEEYIETAKPYRVENAKLLLKVAQEVAIEMERDND